MNNLTKASVSWLIALWTSYVFITSLFYKFDNTALEPQHIFTTIGVWMSETINPVLGDLFANYGAILIGAAEFITAAVLLAPIVIWRKRAALHLAGGLMSIVIMTGAIFFHLFTPLGWNPKWEVANEAACQAVFVTPNYCMDTGLANSALSIFILGFVMIWLNKKTR